MSTIITINGSDKIKDSRSVINTNFANLNADLVAAEADIIALEASASRIPSTGEKAALAGTGGTPSDTNRYVLQNSPLVGATTLTAGETLNGATTPVPVWQNKTDNELYACDANDNARYAFIGFVTSNSTNGNPINFQGSGVVSGFTGLAEGEKYYVQDTVGTIGLTPGTVEILVGVAISETQLLIQKGNRYAGGTTSFGDIGNDGSTSDTVVTCGFRPSLIDVLVYTDDSDASDGTGPTARLVWVNGVSSLGNPGVTHTPSIINVTDSGFTVRVTQVGANTAARTSWVTYSAIGEL